MRKYLAAAGLLAVVVAYGCSDRNGGSPTAPRVGGLRSFSITPGACITPGALTKQLRTTLGSDSDWSESAQEQLAVIISRIAKGSIPQAQTAARALISFINAHTSPNATPTQKAAIQGLINAILCFAGLPPDTILVLPSTTTQNVVSNDGSSGLQVPPGSITVPTLFTFTINDPNGPSGLNTKLDQYPTYLTVSSSTPPTQPVVVAICLGVGVPADVFARLRLGHQRPTAGFEITPQVDASFLGCPTNLASNSRVPGWLHSLAELILPKVAYAKMRMYASGGIGGSAIDFSPFGAVDYGLFATGGVGGSAIDFQQKKPTAPTSPSDTTAARAGVNKSLKASGTGTGTGTGTATVSKGVSAGVCVSVDATVGTALDPLCRPVLTIATAKGTVLTNVPVTWAIASGGGTIAPDTLASQTCGPLGSTAATVTGATGKTGICWTLGALPGMNTVTATPGAGGDAPAGVTFIDPVTGKTLNNVTYTATGLLITTNTAVNCPTSGVLYTGSPLAPCTATVTGADGLNLTGVVIPAASYSANTAVGAATVSYTWPGDATHAASTGTGGFTIGQATSTTNVTCPTTLSYTGVPLTPCSASVTASDGTNLSSVLIPGTAYAANTNVGSATVSYTWPGDASHASSTGTGGFTIVQASSTTTVVCPGPAATYTGSALTPCTGSVTTADGLNFTLLPIAAGSYASNINVGNATVSYTWPGDANHASSTGTGGFSIGLATSTTLVNCPATSTTYTGSAITPCSVSVTGVGGLSLTPQPTYANNTNVGTASASYTYTGDPNHSGSSNSANFSIGLATSSTIVSCPSTVAYSGAVQNPCTASASGAGLSQTVPVGYSPSTVLDAGPYTATATFGGDANHSGSSGGGGFTITKLTATATAGSGTMLLNGTVPSLPCAMGGLLSPTVSCTTKLPTTLVAGINVTTPALSPASPLDYSVTSYNGQLIVGYVQQGCFTSPVSSTLPSATSNSNPRKGTSVTVKCRLLDATGKPVQTASGTLAVVDLGTTGATSGASGPTVLSGAVFTLAGDKNFDTDDGYYTYSLSTSPAGFVTGHYYLLTASWNDGSTTTGYLYVR